MEIGILGSVEVWHGGERLAAGAPQQRCVLAVLALNAGQGVSVERLAEVLWGEEPPGDWRGLVHGYVSRLRKILKPAGLGIVRRSPGYALDAEVDLHVFRDLVVKARAAEHPAPGLFKALALWRGTPFDGAAGGSALDRLRDGLVQEHLAVTEEWVEHELELGRHREVVGELTTLCAEHPYQERLVGLLMLALHRCGRQAESLRRYEEFRRLLADDLGVDPGDELRTLHQRILRSDPALSSATPAPTAPVTPAPAKAPDSLPFDLPDFTGRAEELAKLLGTATDRGGIIAIDGMAGVGKTALAVRAGHSLASRFPDGRLFVDLHGFTPSRAPVQPHAALGVLMRSIGVPSEEIPSEPDDRLVAWRTAMSGRRALLVLDNAADAEQVTPLIPGSPGCVVVVTSRRRLPNLDGAVPLSLQVLPPADAEELFRLVVGEDRGEGAAELVALCGHLPLAVRIAGARLRHRPKWTVADLVERLRTEQARLSELALDGRDVAAAFTLSYQHLDSAQQRMFRLLGVHPGVDVDRHTAAALAALPLTSAEDLLEDLLDHHLLEQRVRDRFQLHDLLRVHATSLVSEVDEPAEAGTRLLDYYLTVTDRAADSLQPGRRRAEPEILRPPASVPDVFTLPDALAWFAAEHPNLLAAGAHAVREGVDRHVRDLPRHLGHYLIISHRIDELVALQEAGLEAVRRLGDTRGQAVNQTQVALTYYMACRYRDSLRHAERNLELTRSLGDPTGQAFALVMLGLVHQRLGHYARARECNEGALSLFSNSDNYRLVAICVGNLGRIALATGDLDTAYRSLSKALVQSQEISERSEEASVRSGLGATLSRQGIHDQALRLLYEGWELAREVGNTDYVVRGRIKLADGHRRAGHLDRALLVASEVVDDLSRGSLVDHLASAWNVLGAVQRDLGSAQAARSFEQALELARRIEYRIELAHALHGLGFTEEAAGHYREMGVGPNPA
ncbi:BTAD domain-containing putative transcriptional regulator [Lentzea sp. E54]|uniref:AfsR/SARP family transcriptional regulator n=1 Tax=Lentzea xerophila TaxID=3435883 RepID=UPI003DA51A20